MLSVPRSAAAGRTAAVSGITSPPAAAQQGPRPETPPAGFRPARDQWARCAAGRFGFDAHVGHIMDGLRAIVAGAHVTGGRGAGSRCTRTASGTPARHGSDDEADRPADPHVKTIV